MTTLDRNIADAKAMIRAYYDADMPCGLIGSPGIGKSQVIAQIAKEARVGFIDVRLSMMDPVDLRGLPSVLNGSTSWNRPAFWPDASRLGERGIILFDEANAAPMSVQVTLYQIMIERRAGEHSLGKWYPCMAGNKQSDKSAAQRTPLALGNRLAWIHVVPQVEATCRHFESIGIDLGLIEFLRYRPGLLHLMPGKKPSETNIPAIPSDSLAFPSPRSWDNSARFISADKRIREGLIAGIVGEGPALELCAFLKARDSLPDLKDILANPSKAKIPGEREPAAQFAVCALLSRIADRKNLAAVYTYLKRLPTREYMIAAMRDIMKRDKSLHETETFSKFTLENQDVTL